MNIIKISTSSLESLPVVCPERIAIMKAKAEQMMKKSQEESRKQEECQKHEQKMVDARANVAFLKKTIKYLRDECSELEYFLESNYHASKILKD